MARQLNVPFGEIGDMTRKQPVSLNVFRLSQSVTTLPTLTTTYEQASSWKLVSGTTGPGQRRSPLRSRSPLAAPALPPIVRDDSFGKWEALPLPDGLTLDQVLARVVAVNSFCAVDPRNILLKVKVRFSDSSEITFVRSNPRDPKTLAYSGYYSPSAAFDSRTHKAAAAATGAPALMKSAASAFVKKGATSSQVTLSSVQFPSQEQIRTLFERLDINGNGMLSLAELDRSVVELWPQYNHKLAIMRAYKAADTNGSGFIAKHEFAVFLRFLVNFNTIWNQFDRMDRNSDRQLSFEEFVGAMKQFEPHKSEDDVRSAFRRLDQSGGGYIRFDEFCAFVSEGRSNVIKPMSVTVSLPRLAATAPAKASKRAAAIAAAAAASKKTLVMPPNTTIKQLFDRLDVNGNGMLSLAELDKAVVELFPSFNSKPTIMRAYKAADTNRTGFVSRTEFDFFLRYLVHFANLWTAFSAIDASADRRVSLQEFLAARERFQIASDADARLAFASMDRNSGGFVLFEEFCDYMARQRAEFELRFVPKQATVARKVQPKTLALPLVKKLDIPNATEMRHLFDRLDPNGNGLLSLAELDKGCVELWPQYNHKPAIMRAYKACDSSVAGHTDGYVSRAEFPFFLSYIVHFTNLYLAFQALDKSADRKVSLSEFLQGAKYLGLRQPEAELRRMFEAMDRNHGGSVLFDEFAAALTESRARQDAA